MPAGIVDSPVSHTKVRIRAERMGSIADELGRQPANTPPTG
jgi:hypothetical protein